jgi:hypothetical protein
MLELLPLAFAAACQPLPHPFADDKPPAALLEIRDTAGVSIAPLVGHPAPVVKTLGAAVAKALVKHDIPASDKTASLDSYQLYGRVVESLPDNGRTTLTALWWLYDAKGRIVGKRSVQVAAAAQDWRTPGSAQVDRLAGLSADQLAPLLEDKMPVAVAPAVAAKRVRIAIDTITGAPSNGGNALATAAAAILRQRNLDVVEDAGTADLRVSCSVSVSPAGSGQQHVKIVWHVRRADGTEIGTVGEENDVPKATLDESWGDTAYSIATAAGDGLMQLVARGAAAPEVAPQAANRP